MTAQYSRKSAKVALILCICLTPLGIQRFYVGRILSGVLMFILGLTWYIWQVYKSITTFALLGLPTDVSISGSGAVLTQTTSQSQTLMDLVMPWVGWAVILWSLLDFFMILFGKFKDKSGYPLKGYFSFNSLKSKT